MWSGMRTRRRNILCSSFNGNAKPLMILEGKERDRERGRRERGGEREERERVRERVRER